MQSIKALVATGAVVASTVGGAYAAGVVNKNGHEVNDHAAHGQAVAAAARAQHQTATPSDTATTSATASTSSEPTETSSTETETATATATATESSTPTETATPSPTAKHLGWTQGQHKGWAKKGKHYGVGHGTGKPAGVTTPTKPTTAASPTKPAKPETAH